MQSSTSTTLPRDFRLRYEDGEHPRTPEPTVRGDFQPPSPPRARLRVKRRNVLNVSGPTEQFLASVAAADVPLPSIEVPDAGEDAQMLDRSATPVPDPTLLVPQPLDFRPSPPRTPIAHLLTLADAPSAHLRDWYMDSDANLNGFTNRPSSSLSNSSDYSDDSFFSGGRIPPPSEDGSCTSPESDVLDPYVLPESSKGKDPAGLLSGITLGPATPTLLNAQIRSKTRHDAPWSEEMSEHLWQTYEVYLQDPTVTPFRLGCNVLPPEGVVYRVAREAKRSWKGPKLANATHVGKQRLSSLGLDTTMSNVEDSGSPDAATSKSGSVTPTANDAAPKVYLQWHHSSAATRHHLKEMCKTKETTFIQRYRHLQSRSPTPFTDRRFRNKNRAFRAQSQNAFSTQEIALSLATSSSQSMQPDGPLPGLAKSAQSTWGGEKYQDKGVDDASKPEKRVHRLGSPFMAKTYGPSSSSGFSTFLKHSPPHGNSGTTSATGPCLRSPVSFNNRRSLNGTQKRRAQHSLEDELSPSGGVFRPSILDNHLFGRAPEGKQRRVRSRGFSLGDETFVVPTKSGSSSVKKPPGPLLPSAEFRQTRLGSPFAETGPSNTFPRRFPQQMDTNTVRKRDFATVHHTRRSIDSFDLGDGSSLQSRLNSLDEKLAELRDRNAADSTEPKQ